MVTEAASPGFDQPGNREELWMFPETNFANIAREMGCFGIRVEQPGQIQSAIDEAIASGKPALVSNSVRW